MSAITQINSVILTSNSTTVTFSNIPQIFNDLMIVTTGPGANSNTNGYTVLRYNQNSSSVYSRTLLSGASTSVTSGRVANETATYSGIGTNGSVPSNSIFHIFSYSSSNLNKLSVELGLTDPSSATIRLTSVLFRQTAPITRIDITGAGTDSFVAGTGFELWGVV